MPTDGPKRLRNFKVFTSGLESPVMVQADTVHLHDAGALDYKAAEFTVYGETVAFFISGYFNGYTVAEGEV